MKTPAILMLLAVFVFGCSKSDGSLSGYRKSSGDLSSFVLESATSFGAPSPKNGSFPRIQAEWRYKRDKDGIQIYVAEDYLPQVRTLLTGAFGQPAISKTNNEGVVSAAEFVASTGRAVIQFGCETLPDGKRYMDVLIVRGSAL
jgi:hypothetical protein